MKRVYAENKNKYLVLRKTSFKGKTRLFLTGRYSICFHCFKHELKKQDLISEVNLSSFHNCLDICTGK